MRFIPERLRAARVRAGYKTPSALHVSLIRAGMDITCTTLVAWENGLTPNPGAAALMTVAKHLGADVRSFFSAGGGA